MRASFDPVTEGRVPSSIVSRTIRLRPSSFRPILRSTKRCVGMTAMRSLVRYSVLSLSLSLYRYRINATMKNRIRDCSAGRAYVRKSASLHEKTYQNSKLYDLFDLRSRKDGREFISREFKRNASPVAGKFTKIWALASSYREEEA